MRRTAENRAGAVIHQDEIGHIERHFRGLAEGMHDLQAGVVALFLRALDLFRAGAHAVAFVDEAFQLLVLFRQRGRQRMIRRHGAEGHAENRVRPGGEHLQRLMPLRQRLAFQRKAHQEALGAADPVALHQPDLVRPAVERIQRGEQVVGIVGDLQEPLAQLALLHQRARAPAAPVDHLLIGEHGVVNRVPIDLALLAVHQPLIEEIDEQLLLLRVIFRIAGGDLAAPVQRQAHALELAAHGVDILIGGCLGMDPALQRGVLRRHAEAVPSHRVQDIVALGPSVARDHISHGVIAHMAYMDASGRIWEHLQNIVFRPRFVLFRAVDFGVIPDLAPMRFAIGGVIAFRGHCVCLTCFWPPLDAGGASVWYPAEKGWCGQAALGRQA